MDLSMLAAIAAIVALPTSLLLWMMAKLHNDIASALHRIDSTIAAGNARDDLLNARIDQTQSIIMRMLEKQGK